MTPPAATAARRRETVRRRTASRRRRRSVLIFGAMVAAAVGITLAMPLFREAVNELTLPLYYQDIIRQQAAEKHLDPALIAAVIDTETKFDARTSPTGALGLMQIEPATAEFLARRSGGTTFAVSDLAQPAVNIAYGSYYLRYLLDEYHDNLTLALAAYNGGETNVDHWLAAARARGDAFTVGDIPFLETRAYVLRVVSTERDYRQTYATQLYG
jgi:soluble lytic murein transglycosylase